MMRYKSVRKVNERGEFQPFPGVTVVSKAFDNNPALCEQIYNCISSIEGIRDYYALLPFASYHMTSFGVCTQRYEGGNDWNAFIDRSLSYFQDLGTCVNSHKFDPQISFSSVEREGAIQVVVNLLHDQDRMIHTIAHQVDRTPAVPSEFHITLAYQYNMGVTIPKRIWAEIQQNILLVFKDLPPITLAPPRLCYFESMTAFIPWDGKANPFIPQSPNNFSRSPVFFGSQVPAIDSGHNSEKILPLSYKS